MEFKEVGPTLHVPTLIGILPKMAYENYTVSFIPYAH